ncbi:MAG: NAD(P)-binding protein [Pseudomonadota bacterium]|nr:NAD(P)-binding protein [Pseudomonadota bacterium]
MVVSYKYVIIGAGITGAYLAKRLSSCSKVACIEKARGPGGRISARRLDTGSYCPLGAVEGLNLEHTAGESPLMQTNLSPHSLIWKNTPDPPSYRTYKNPLPFPPQNICHTWLADSSCYYGHAITHITHSTQGWQLYNHDKLVCYADWVITTTPPEQALQILPDTCSYASKLHLVRFTPTVSMVLGLLEQPTHRFWAALSAHKSSLYAVNTYPSSPEDPLTYVTAHASSAWSRKMLDQTDASIYKQISSLLLRCGWDKDNLHTDPFYHVHRWRFAHCTAPLNLPFLADHTLKLASAGDWCLGSNLNTAIHSAYQLAQHLLHHPN